LVWNPTLTDWQEYDKVKPSGVSPGLSGQRLSGRQSICSECGKDYSPDDMMRLENVWVCGNCKPILVQKLKEGVALPGATEYGGFWIRVVAKLIDGMILSAINMAIYLPAGAMALPPAEPYRFITRTVILNLLLMAIQAAYVTFFVGRYGATPGKMAGRLRVVTSDGGKVAYLRAFGRHFAEFLSSMILGIGYIMAAFDDQKRTLHDRICNTRVVKTS
jgi:uncharacterized RDD family membrane protein YckC